MSTIGNYIKIKDTYPEMRKCFYAFNEKQLDEGRAKAGIALDEKIYHYGAGLCGTREGVTEYLKGIDEIIARIPKECDPQEVYDYEYENHECGYIGEDTEAIKLVVSYFGEEIAKTVTRRFGYADIDTLFEPEN